jgi:hypothetical protein
LVIVFIIVTSPSERVISGLLTNTVIEANTFYSQVSHYDQEPFLPEPYLLGEFACLGMDRKRMQ